MFGSVEQPVGYLVTGTTVHWRQAPRLPEQFVPGRVAAGEDEVPFFRAELAGGTDGGGFFAKGFCAVNSARERHKLRASTIVESNKFLDSRMDVNPPF